MSRYLTEFRCTNVEYFSGNKLWLQVCNLKAAERQGASDGPMKARAAGDVTVRQPISIVLAVGHLLQQETQVIQAVSMATPHQRRHAVVVTDANVRAVA